VSFNICLYFVWNILKGLTGNIADPCQKQIRKKGEESKVISKAKNQIFWDVCYGQHHSLVLSHRTIGISGMLCIQNISLGNNNNNKME
jgi:hypothetical protein